MVVVLDPGHGGEDVGVQAGEVREARLTLAIARRIAATLVAHGARVALTRKDDTAISEDERASLANRAGGRVFVSVHLNRSRHQASIGAEVYTHESQVRNSSLNSDAFTSTRVAGLVRWDHVQDRHRPDAERLADYIESALGARIPLSRHPRYSLPLRTLAGADMPAVLLELAYLSNPDQAAAVVTEKFQTSVAAAIAVALENYRLGVGSR
jgi:N-acetylmuramoyl-L-alanine amidase